MIVETLNGTMSINALEVSTLDFERALASCRKDCEAAATAAGFPLKAGYDILIGCIANHFDGWSPDDFNLWVQRVIENYGEISAKGVRVLELYELVSFLTTEPRHRPKQRLLRALTKSA
jgi:hypothetical protein